jgi:hypothetical protein
MRAFVIVALLAAMAATARAGDCTPSLERPYFVPHRPSPMFGVPRVRSLVAEAGVLRIDADLPEEAVYLRIMWRDADLWLRASQREVCIPDGFVASRTAQVMAVNISGDATVVTQPVKIISLHPDRTWRILRGLAMSPIAAGLALLMWLLVRRHRRGHARPAHAVPVAALANTRRR